MTTTSTASMSGDGYSSWPRRAEQWLDSKGKGAWIAAMVLGFVFFWPAGLALLAYMIWSKRMFSKSSSCAARRRDRHMAWGTHGAMRSSGNTVFDAYKSETLRRLEEEQQAFEAFLQRLRDAKDKSEFDSFMEERARANQAAAQSASQAGPTDAPRPGEY